MKKFLTAFAGIAAAFASDAAPAAAPTQNNTVSPDAHNVSVQQISALSENIATIDAKGDQYNFILKKAEGTGLLMAWHSSHSSHASHASHRSHYSSRY